MKDLTEIYIDLRKCTEEQRKHIFSLLPEPEKPDYYEVYKNYKYLQFIPASKFGNDRWMVDKQAFGKTELTYPEFIKLFEEPKTITETLKEYFKNTPKDQVVKDWESVSEFDNVNSPKVSELFEGEDIDNNGWIKIKSEADLPKEKGAYYCYHKSGLITERCFYPDGILTEGPEWGEYDSEILEQSDITHYQKMPPTPEPPKF